MTIIVIDGMNEEDFRRSIEFKLRAGKAGESAQRLRALLSSYAGPGQILPERFLTVLSGDLSLEGWEGLAESVRRHDRPGSPITALSIAFGWPGEDAPLPDSQGNLNPLIETGYLTDDSFPFSQSRRDDLLDGYSFGGCTWGNDFEATDTHLKLHGIDDLCGALARLEMRLLACDEPDKHEIIAGSLGSCLLSVLLFQAVGERIARDGLPRPLCVMAGSNGVYPYFDAPVVGMSDDAIRAAEAAEVAGGTGPGIPGPRYSSLLMTSIPRAKKRAVLVLDEGADEMAKRIASLRGHPADADDAAVLSQEPQPTDAGIIPAPHGPLLTKKTPKPSWDFRDMLGPGEADPPPGEQPAEDKPGFTLYESDTMERLQLLVDRHIALEAPSPAPSHPLPTPAEVTPPVFASPEFAPPLPDRLEPEPPLEAVALATAPIEEPRREVTLMQRAWNRLRAALAWRGR